MQQAVHLQDAGTQAANRVRQAAHDEAARVQQRQLPNPSDDVTALIARGDYRPSPGFSISRALVEDWFGGPLPSGPGGP